MKITASVIFLSILTISIACKTPGKADQDKQNNTIDTDSLITETLPPDTLSEINTSMKDSIKQVDQQTNKVDELLMSPLKIKYGVSYGECVGYCKYEYRFSTTGIEYIKSSFDPQKNKDIIEMLPITKTDYDRLLAAVDFDKFRALDERIGCPGCDDSGASWLEITKDNVTKYVKYEEPNPPAALQEIHGIINGILKRE